MKIEVPEGQTTSQYVTGLGREGIADMALDQGYSEPHAKADAIFTHHQSERQKQLDALLGKRKKIGNYTLLALGDGTIALVDELTSN